jgi:hypothetical protein
MPISGRSLYARAGSATSTVSTIDKVLRIATGRWRNMEEGKEKKRRENAWWDDGKKERGGKMCGSVYRCCLRQLRKCLDYRVR